MFVLVVALPLAFFPQSRNAFLDVKILLLAGGTLLVWFGGVPLDRRIALPAFAWGGVVVLAAVVGVDPVESLIGTVRGSGLVLLLCLAALVAMGPSLPEGLLERARRWLLWAGLIVAVVAVTFRLAPEVLEPIARRVAFVGSTLGNPVRLTALLAACIPALLAEKRWRWTGVLALAVLGLGLASAEERSAYVLPVVAIAASAWFVRPGWRRIATATGVVAAALALWAMAPTSVVSNAPSDRFTAVGQFQTLEGERQRIAVYQVNVRAFADRPVFGWGPANAWSGFLSSGTADQIDEAGRNWADAHNIVLELAVVTGAIGLVAFGWLVIRLAPRTLRPRSGRRWAAAAAVTLVAFALVEPLDVVLTPLLFLLAGAAAGRGTGVVGAPEAAEASRRAWPPGISAAVRAATMVVLAASTVLAATNLGASALEEWGHSHSESNWALRAAKDLAPWRLTASEALAISLAVDGRAGDDAAAAEARDVVGTVVERHPWNPGVRLLAADVELLLRNFPATQDWIREQLATFPNDSVEVPRTEPEFSLPS